MIVAEECKYGDDLLNANSHEARCTRWKKSMFVEEARSAGACKDEVGYVEGVHGLEANLHHGGVDLVTGG